MPNFAGDARAALLFVYMLTRAGEAAVEVDDAAVTEGVPSPRKAFFVGWRVEGSREYPIRLLCLSSPALRKLSVRRLTRGPSLGVWTGVALRVGEPLQRLMMEYPSASVITLIVVVDSLVSTRDLARVLS